MNRFPMSLALAHILEESGLPGGVLNLFNRSLLLGKTRSRHPRSRKRKRRYRAQRGPHALEHASRSDPQCGPMERGWKPHPLVFETPISRAFLRRLPPRNAHIRLDVQRRHTSPRCPIRLAGSGAKKARREDARSRWGAATEEGGKVGVRLSPDAVDS